MHELQFFDPNQDISIVHKRLPHWSQTSTVVFITWRTADSLPAEVLARIDKERAEHLRQFDLDANGNPGAPELENLPQIERGKLQQSLFELWDCQLDRGAGDCVLARPECSQLIAESLRHFDEERYLLTDFVVMPNHVHVLVAFATDDEMLVQCTSWKRFTARRINGLLGR